MRHFLLSTAILLAICLAGQAIAQTPAASEIVKQAKMESAQQHKAILLVFQASWCEPCRQFEAFLADAKMAPVLEKHFVIAKLTVGEEANGHRELNSPGGEALMVKLHGATSGLPFLAMLNAKGDMIINSNRSDNSSENIGYPATPEEVHWFITMLKKGAPSLTDKESGAVADWLSAHAEAGN